MSQMPQTTTKTVIVKEGEIRLILQPDGNWKGYMTREGNPIEVREVNPQDCVVKLLTYG